MSGLKRAHPPPPDPKIEVATFLGWLQKMGGLTKLKRAEKECEKLEINLENVLTDFSPSKISKKKRTGKKGTTVVIVLEDPSWADAWARYYNVNPPHHRHKKKL
jgi:hypothetical protein